MVMSDWKYVDSSVIKAVRYDPDQGILQIEFNSGQVYEYYDVPQHEFDGLMSADSHGSYANHNIFYSYRYERIG